MDYRLFSPGHTLQICYYFIETDDKLTLSLSFGNSLINLLINFISLIVYIYPP